MFSKWQWILVQLLRALWVRATLFALAAVVIVLLAIPLQTLIAEPLPFNIGSDAVGQILDILATSMLTVTTFSLSVMVTAYGAASNSVTPRATQLVKQDSTSQTVLATFLGTFLFSLVGILALSTDVYTEGGRLILFIATLGIILLIAVTILRWIEHLSLLGRVGETARRVEEKAKDALQQRIDYPALGANILESDTVPSNAARVYGDGVGYIQHVDLVALSDIAEKHETDIYVLCPAGTLIHPARPLAWYVGDKKEAVMTVIRDAFTLADGRSFDQDPRFGLIVLSEIASRALSPAVNDPGTAIDIIGRQLRLMMMLVRTPEATESSELRYPRIYLPALDTRDLFDDCFLPIARDGAGFIEVHMRLQKALVALSQSGDPGLAATAARYSELALQFAEQGLGQDRELEVLIEIRSQLKAVA